MTDTDEIFVIKESEKQDAEPKPKLERASFEFTQEAHCLSSEEYETLTVDYESDLGIDNTVGGFFVLKTEQWAVNDEQDLKNLFNRIERILKPQK